MVSFDVSEVVDAEVESFLDGLGFAFAGQESQHVDLLEQENVVFDVWYAGEALFAHVRINTMPHNIKWHRERLLALPQLKHVKIDFVDLPLVVYQVQVVCARMEDHVARHHVEVQVEDDLQLVDAGYDDLAIV